MNQDPLTEAKKQLFDYVNGELLKAKESGEPPLVLLMEQHTNRDALALEILLTSHLKKEVDARLLVESTKEVHKNWMNSSREVHKALRSGRQTSPTGSGPTANEMCKMIPNVVVLADIATNAKLSVQYTTKSELPGYYDGSMSNSANFYPRMTDTDERLCKLLGSNSVGPTVMVVGLFHGRAIADFAKNYHVIPIALMKAEPIRYTNLGNPIDVGEVIERLEAGEDLSQNEKYIAETHNFAFKGLCLVQDLGLDSIHRSLKSVVKQPNIFYVDRKIVWFQLEPGSGHERTM